MVDLNGYSLKNKLFRKSIHIGGISVVFVSMYLGVIVAALLIVILSVLYVTSEYVRLRGNRITGNLQSY